MDAQSFDPRGGNVPSFARSAGQRRETTVSPPSPHVAPHTLPFATHSTPSGGRPPRGDASNSPVDWQHRAEQAARDLEEFVYVVSHDLKAPLHAIKFYCRFLWDDHAAQLDSEARGKIDMLSSQAGELEAMLDALLQYSRLGRQVLDRKPRELQALVRQVLGRMHDELNQRGAVVEVPAHLPTLVCDESLGRVFEALIRNAAQYNTRGERRIEVGWSPEPSVAHESDHHTLFWVRDQGIGIRPKDFDRIFTIFQRLHAPDKFGGGLGIGLTLARRTVERHGGRIWLESVLTEGSTFYFTVEGSPSDCL